MIVLRFQGEDVFRLLQHTRESKMHKNAEDSSESASPGLLLVKSTEIYLKSNGFPRLRVEEIVEGIPVLHKVVAFAEGYLPRGESDDKSWNVQRERLQAVCTLDFVEFVPDDDFLLSFLPTETLVIELSDKSFRVLIETKPRNRRVSP